MPSSYLLAGLCSCLLLFVNDIPLLADDPQASDTFAIEVSERPRADERSRLEAFCEKSKKFQLSKDSRFGFVDIRTAKEKLRLQAKRLTARELTEDDFKAVSDIAVHFPELTEVNLRFTSSVTKTPIDALLALQNMPALRSATFFFTSGVVWDKPSMDAIIGRTKFCTIPTWTPSSNEMYVPVITRIINTSIPFRSRVALAHHSMLRLTIKSAIGTTRSMGRGHYVIGPRNFPASSCCIVIV